MPRPLKDGSGDGQSERTPVARLKLEAEEVLEKQVRNGKESMEVVLNVQRGEGKEDFGEGKADLA